MTARGAPGGPHKNTNEPKKDGETLRRVDGRSVARDALSSDGAMRRLVLSRHGRNVPQLKSGPIPNDENQYRNAYNEIAMSNTIGACGIFVITAAWINN